MGRRLLHLVVAIMTMIAATIDEMIGALAMVDDIMKTADMMRIGARIGARIGVRIGVMIGVMSATQTTSDAMAMIGEKEAVAMSVGILLAMTRRCGQGELLLKSGLIDEGRRGVVAIELPI